MLVDDLTRTPLWAGLLIERRRTARRRLQLDSLPVSASVLPTKLLAFRDWDAPTVNLLCEYPLKCVRLGEAEASGYSAKLEQ